MSDNRTAEERFWAFVKKGEGCWEWQGKTDPRGYARFCVSGGNVRTGRPTIRDGAHRYSWRLQNGPIPEGLFICHHCDNPRCVRPDHLFLGTQGDNVRDCLAKGRGRKRSTHCKRGHLLPDANVRHGRRRRGCKLCHRDWYAGNRLKTTGAPPMIAPRKRTHCANGHAYTPENTIQVPRDWGTERRCRICARDSKLRTLERRKAS